MGGYPPLAREGIPPPPQGVGQQMEYLIRRGRYAACVHTGGHSCLIILLVSHCARHLLDLRLNTNLILCVEYVVRGKVIVSQAFVILLRGRREGGRVPPVHVLSGRGEVGYILFMKVLSWSCWGRG